VPLECILCARQGAHMAPGQVSDQCQIVLGANLANLGPYPFGQTLWKRGVQYATKHMRISCWGPVWDGFRSTFNSAGQVPRAFSVRGTFSRRCSIRRQNTARPLFWTRTILDVRSLAGRRNDMDQTRDPRRPNTLINDREPIVGHSDEARYSDRRFHPV